ncbi:MAG: hypothetical protein US86_C0004G0040 [Candidatus Daviesbacteria bacterium GW2011_GWA2_38_24]|uniref:TRAM domain-containing protein n=1 Tax=Candidatus Daviesbacteria bacterium GW2011_GWA2_38_24 TaxID=1618422 RepID=A0A0G0JIX5_9BACT|nr:MAG: hypothetical protein US86_C0004G0040 [Candidatus Daviesbacteria bacterium GW2011_GWA2_38_24]OGE23057.1 MAG: hypothetical protein A2688_03635 [Candidatus Daviesbacteria bacterium RIFCSPHIGHO2_01_FULL_38_8]
MRITFYLRLVLAVIFALVAFIFSEVIPDLHPFGSIYLRVAITIWFGLLGFGVFPDIAKRVTTITLNTVNSFITMITTEIMNQMVRLPKQSGGVTAPVPTNAPVGGVSINQPLILDTSAIIDGRVLDIAKTGFVYGLLLVPQFVLEEIQQVADSSDYLKRSRGRRGFEVIEELKKIKGVRIQVWENGVAGKGVDDKLIRLAKNLHGKIITTDFNLNKVATLSSVNVLNVNDLANAVKTLAIPGEVIEVKVIHIGKDPKQGVGYFQDGTMIVVEDGAELVGKTIKAEVTRVLQGSAGRMVFTKKR